MVKPTNEVERELQGRKKNCSFSMCRTDFLFSSLFLELSLPGMRAFQVRSLGSVGSRQILPHNWYMYPQAICGAIEDTIQISFIDFQGKMTLQQWGTRRRGDGHPRCCPKLGNQWGGKKHQPREWDSPLWIRGESPIVLEMKQSGINRERVKKEEIKRSSARRNFLFSCDYNFAGNTRR